MPGDNINIEIVTTQQNVDVDVSTARAVWGTIIGSLTAQTDLWSVLSSSKVDFNTLQTFVQSNSAQWGNDLQTLTYIPSSLQISITNGNTITLNNLITKTQALAYSIAL
jgi:hypothetical protein